MKRPDDVNSDYAVALERRRKFVVRPERGFLLDTPAPRKENKSLFLLRLELEQATAAARAASDNCARFYAIAGHAGLFEPQIRRVPPFLSDRRGTWFGDSLAPQPIKTPAAVLPFRRQEGPDDA